MNQMELPTLKELRTERGVTQAHLASRLGIHQTALSRLEGRTDVSVSMLKSFVEALGGKLHVSAVFPDVAIILDKLADTPTLSDLQGLVLQQCCVYPMPADRAADRFLVRRVDESLVELEKLSNCQLVEIPVRRVLEVLPPASSGPPTIVLRGSLQWSAHERLWKVALE